MIERPEGLVLAEQAAALLKGKTVEKVEPPTNEHKFAWFNADNAAVNATLCGKTFSGAESYGNYFDCTFGDAHLAVHDGVVPRYHSAGSEAPQKYQMLVRFTDGSFMTHSVAMYGGMYCFIGEFDSEYYNLNRFRVSPLSDKFTREYFTGLFGEVKPGASAKEFLATKQRIPGLGNGVLHDILFTARINPKRKLDNLTASDREKLYDAIAGVMSEMVRGGGRDTEKDLLGISGGYRTLMSKYTYLAGCPACGGTVTKEAYMGGSVYYCPVCQPKFV